MLLVLNSTDVREKLERLCYLQLLRENRNTPLNTYTFFFFLVIFKWTTVDTMSVWNALSSYEMGITTCFYKDTTVLYLNIKVVDI